MGTMAGRWVAAAATIALLLTVSPALHGQQDTTELARIRTQIDALTRELEALRLGQDVLPQADSSAHGLGPAAAKVYRVRHGVSLGGYGEVLYENFAAERENGEASNLRDQIDALRAIIYVGYRFTDNLLFNSEIEFEHASTDQAGSVSVEFAYLDYIPSPYLGVRGGMVLVPMGFINELHEPPIFLGTTRPLTENSIIPTTWRENGFGVFGDFGDFAYRAYVVNGLDAIGGGPSRAGGFSAGGLRGGRQKGSRALIEDPAIVGRLDFEPAGMLPGLLLGASAYHGNSGQSGMTPAGVEVDAPTTILEGHAQYRAYGLDLRALAARATVGDAALINEARTLTGTSSVGEELVGWYAQGGYDVLRLVRSMQELTPYVRYEKLNTQHVVPEGFTASRATDRSVLAVGAQWKPITNVVVKGDYQIHSNEASTGVNQFNIVLGYLF
ncbi:MAG TPA: hypothetical protein VK912_09520 [Longimicrobiales bacterium]|nr:hypothetical protein [Longimicrobiales bacterium]